VSGLIVGGVTGGLARGMALRLGIRSSRTSIPAFDDAHWRWPNLLASPDDRTECIGIRPEERAVKQVCINNAWTASTCVHRRGSGSKGSEQVSARPQRTQAGRRVVVGESPSRRQPGTAEPSGRGGSSAGCAAARSTRDGRPWTPESRSRDTGRAVQGVDADLLDRHVSSGRCDANQFASGLASR